MSRGYADLRNHGADDGCSRRWHDGYALLGRAWVSADRNGPDVRADECLPFGALAEADLQAVKRRPPVHIRRSPNRTQIIRLVDRPGRRQRGLRRDWQAGADAADRQGDAGLAKPLGDAVGTGVADRPEAVASEEPIEPAIWPAPGAELLASAFLGLLVVPYAFKGIGDCGPPSGALSSCHTLLTRQMAKRFGSSLSARLTLQVDRSSGASQKPTPAPEAHSSTRTPPAE